MYLQNTNLKNTMQRKGQRIQMRQEIQQVYRNPTMRAEFDENWTTIRISADFSSNELITPNEEKVMLN